MFNPTHPPTPELCYNSPTDAWTYFKLVPEEGHPSILSAFNTQVGVDHTNQPTCCDHFGIDLNGDFSASLLIPPHPTPGHTPKQLVIHSRFITMEDNHHGALNVASIFLLHELHYHTGEIFTALTVTNLRSTHVLREYSCIWSSLRSLENLFVTITEQF